MKSVQTMIHVIQGNSGSCFATGQHVTLVSFMSMLSIFVLVQECVTCWCKTTQSCLRVLAS